jgi:outer membrane protein OmpA-like peptidoglycan-associated protein
MLISLIFEVIMPTEVTQREKKPITMSKPTSPDPFGAISISRPEPPAPGRKPEQIPLPAQPPSFSRQGLPPKKKPWPLALILALLCLVSVIYVVGSYLFVPHLFKSVIPQVLARRLDRPVTIGQADFNPFTLHLTLTNGIIGPRLSDPNDKVDPILSFSSLSLDLEAVSLVRRAFICRELTLNQPFIHLVHGLDNRFNLATLLPSTDQAARLPLPWLFTLMTQRYAINNITVSKGEVLYDDLPTSKVHHLEEVNISLPTIANINFRSGELRPHVSALVNGTPVEMHGQAQMADGSMTARLTMKMTNLDLATYTNYLPTSLNVQSLNGQADLALDLFYDTAKADKLRLIGTVSLRNAQATAGQGRLSVDSGVLKGWITPFANQFHADDITLNHPVWLRPVGQAIPWTAMMAAILHPDPKQPGLLAIDHLQITKGETRSTAAATAGQWSDWQDIDASITSPAQAPGDSNPPKQALFSVNAKNSAGGKISLQGNVDKAPFSAKGVMIATMIDTAAMRQIWQGVGLSLPVTGGMVEQAQANFSLTQDANQRLALTLDPVSIQAKDLRIEQNDQVLEIPVWQSEHGSFSLTDPILHLGKVKLQQARLTCRRQSGNGSWQTLWTPPEDKATTPDGVDMSSLDLNNGTLLIENQGPPDFTLHLERFDLQAEHLDPHQPNSVNAAAMVDNKYPLQAAGTFSLAPFSASLKIHTSDLPLSVFQPVLDYTFASPMNGVLSAEGTLSLPSLDYHGQWTIDSLSAPPISCRRLTGEGTAFIVNPLSLAIDRLTLDGPALQLTASPTGMPILPTLMKSEWQPAPTPQAATVAIKAIDLADGRLTYDLPGPPGFTMNFQKLTGSITDLVVAKDQAIPFTVSGLMESTAEFQAQGTITPFAHQPGLALTSQFKGLPLTSLAPLLEPHWGFTIKAGTLDFDDKLTYEDTLIEDSSHLALHDLSLGQPLAVPAIKAIGTTWQSLPLIQAMLQDATGTIQVTVPIDGRTDTGFTYSGGMRTYLNQLLLKATVSPMNVLNDSQKALTDPLEFKPGSDRLYTKGEEQLNGLVSLLKDRPLLAVSIEGFADSVTDEKALAPAKKIAPPRPPSKGPGSVNEESLLSLATRRGQAVHEFLANQGLAPRQLRLTQPEVIASGRAGRSGRRVTLGLSVLE